MLKERRVAVKVKKPDCARGEEVVAWAGQPEPGMSMLAGGAPRNLGHPQTPIGTLLLLARAGTKLHYWARKHFFFLCIAG